MKIRGTLFSFYRPEPSADERITQQKQALLAVKILIIYDKNLLKTYKFR